MLDYPILQETGLLFNTHRAPFDDARVRRAFNLSLDRDRIVKAALAGYALAATGPVAPESPYALVASEARDPHTADSLLDAAGWRRAADGMRGRAGKPLTVELLTVGSGDQAVEQLVQADLAERGMTVGNPRVAGAGVRRFFWRARAPCPRRSICCSREFQATSRSPISAPCTTAASAGSALDYADYHTPRLDSLFARARSATTRDATVSAWYDAWQSELATPDVPAAWIYHSRGLQGIARRMQGVTMDLRGELTSLASWTVSTSPAPR